MDTEQTKARIIGRLNETNRQGIDVLIRRLLSDGFFTSPASHKFHGCYRGGLASHSLKLVYFCDEIASMEEKASENKP